MVDPRLEALIQSDLDGQLSGPDRAELARELLENPQARQLRDDLARVHEALSGLPSEPAPPGLRDVVMDSIFGTPAEEEAAGPASVPGRTVLFRYAAVFLGGLVVAALSFYLSAPSGPADPRDLVGTMASGPLPGEPAAGASLRAGPSEADTRVYRAGKRVVLELEIAGDGASELEIRFDPDRLRLVEIVQGAGRGAAPKEGSDVGSGRLLLPGHADLRQVHFEGPASGEVRLDVALRSAAGDQAQETLIASAGR